MYMGKKKRRYNVKTKSRMFIIFIFFGAIIGTLAFTLFRDLNKINEMHQQLNHLSLEKDNLLEREEMIQADIKKLSDPLYVSRYIREKYFYSKEGEIILRIKDDTK